MNIFYLDRDPVKAARVMYNRHVVKMILESAQMLCTAHHYFAEQYDYKTFVPYKKAHLNHPSTRWARGNRAQYLWLYKHMMALGDEYTKRYGKKHVSITKCQPSLQFAPNGIVDGFFKDPPQCMPDQYKCGDTVEAYWNYYEGEKFAVANANETKITRNAHR